MSGIMRTGVLELNSERGEEIIEAISSHHRDEASCMRVTVMPVSTYVSQPKEEYASSAWVPPKQPPFASHWGIVVGDIDQRGKAWLFHLMLREDGKEREVVFRTTDVDRNSAWIKGAAVKEIGETRFTVQQLRDIGYEMIDAFGNYHVVFWNCQMFAKCYLRVITRSDAAFSEWTSADATNLFLCSVIVPMPIASSSRTKEVRKMKKLDNVGRQAATEQELGNEEGDGNEEERLFKASDEVIDLMKESWRDDDTLKKLSRPMKDSSDKWSLIDGIESLLSKVVESSQ